MTKKIRELAKYYLRKYDKCFKNLAKHDSKKDK